MKLKLKDFGIISNAEIDIGGLTVITGENDSGKSTIGKVVFSIIKALASYQTEFLEDRDARLNDLVEETYFSLRRYINFAEDVSIRDSFFPPSFVDNIKREGEQAVLKRKSVLLEIRESKFFDRKFREKLVNNLDEIIKIISEPADKVSAMKAVFKRIINSEFKGGVVQKGIHTNSKASISIMDGENLLIDLLWSNTDSFDFKFYDSLSFEDATYVESNSVLQVHGMMDLFQNNKLSSRSPKGILPLHMTDIAYKLRRSIYNIGLHMNQDGITNRLSDIYGGKFYFDKEKLDFILDKNGQRFSSEIVASGIKSLGMIDILLQSGVANSNSLLILDEPETNLHPKWQIMYAELICDIVAAGANIMISTHSPYILEALSGFSKEKKQVAHFYMSTKNVSGFSSLQNISLDIQPAIFMLSEPMLDLNTRLNTDI